MFRKKHTNKLDSEVKCAKLQNEELSQIEGGKTDTVTLHLHATVPEKVQPVMNANGYAIESNIPNAQVSTVDTKDGTFVNVTAT